MSHSYWQRGFATAISEQVLADPTDPNCQYLKISGTSQATAVVSGLAACLLQKAREQRVDLGPNQAHALKALILRGARRLPSGHRYDFGSGLVTWPVLQQELRDFATDTKHRERVLKGPQLKLME